jgi:sulfoxide reductase heme-binding subunit YedZ
MRQLISELLDQVGTTADQNPDSQPIWTRVVKYALPIVFLIVLVVPGYTYFVVNRAADLLFGPGVDPAVRFYTLFRLIGLYAFVFLWGNIMLGAFMIPLNKLYRRNWLYFHRWQGIFALLLAFLHPPVLWLGYYLQSGSLSPVGALERYVGEPMMLFGLFGVAASILLLITVSSALLMRQPRMRRSWRWIHLLNYVTFLLVFIHAYVLGTESVVMPMNLLYPFVGLTFLAALAYRRVYVPAIGRDTLPKIRPSTSSAQ